MLKDNHIAAAGGIKNAIESVRNNIPHSVKIEVEVKNFAELDDAIESRADIVMLDNMKPEDIKKAVKIIRDRAKSIIIEASGGINLSNFEDYCRTGVDLISLGCLTHSAPAVRLFHGVWISFGQVYTYNHRPSSGIKFPLTGFCHEVFPSAHPPQNIMELNGP